MGLNVTVNGIVISAIPIGENDKRILILTEERGKISAFAKGARRQNSPLLAPSNPFVFGEFELFQGRNSYTVGKVFVKNYFEKITGNLDKIYYGCYFLEMADYYTQENNDEREMLKLLYITLRALESDKINYRLIRYIYELKTLVINGEYPQIFSCRKCSNNEELNGFSLSFQGCICNKCKNNVSDYESIDTSTIYTMQFVVSSKINKLYTFALSEKILNEFGKIMERFLKRYIDKSFKTLDILDEKYYLPVEKIIYKGYNGKD